MLRALTPMTGYTVLSLDAEIGQLHDFYVDVERWSAPYFLVDADPWLPGRKVLISIVALDQPVWEKHLFPVKLKRKEIERSPPFDPDQPLSHQKTAELHKHYGWPPLDRLESGLFDRQALGLG